MSQKTIEDHAAEAIAKIKDARNERAAGQYANAAMSYRAAAASLQDAIFQCDTLADAPRGTFMPRG